MTPTEIVTMARQRYNAVGDTFWSDSELYDLIYQASTELAVDGLLIEKDFTTETVVDQEEYEFPTNMFSVKRITYNGRRLIPISFAELDDMRGQNTSISGTPSYYVQFEETLTLHPIPSDTVTLDIWGYCRPQRVSSTSTIELTDEWHTPITNFLLREMAAKNKNYEGASYYNELWEKDRARAIRAGRKKKRGGAFHKVRPNEVTLYG